MHSAHVALPAEVALVPPGHRAQAAAPLCEAMLPAGHSVQAAAPASEMLPAAQAVQLALPSGEKVPVAQAWELQATRALPAAQLAVHGVAVGAGVVVGCGVVLGGGVGFGVRTSILFLAAVYELFEPFPSRAGLFPGQHCSARACRSSCRSSFAGVSEVHQRNIILQHTS